MAIQLFRCPYCDRDNDVYENTCLLRTGLILQCAHCKTTLETWLIDSNKQEPKFIDKLTVMASSFCPKCWSPTKLLNRNFRFSLVCRGLSCLQTKWYLTEMQAREELVERSAEILEIERKVEK